MKMLRAILALLTLLPCACLAQGVGIGQRFDLTAELQLNQGTTGQFAQVFVPNYFQASDDGKFMLVFHLHSASWAAENEVYKARANAVLFNIHLGALSSPYQTYFQDANKFRLILDKVKAVLQNHTVIANPEVDTLIVTSFSAGYAGVREIFKTSAYYSQITALALADGLHCNSDPALKEQQMRDFLHFARDARYGQKIFCLTHSAIPTSGYESTTQTANYLINGIGAQRRSVSAVDEIGFQQSACDTGYFHLKGYSGETASDHMNHLYGMHLMLEQIIQTLHQTTVGGNDRLIHPDQYLFVRNYPNPFNSITHFVYQLPYSAPVNLKIYDAIGQLVAVVSDEEVQASGVHILSWNGSRYSSGIYVYQLTWGGKTQSGRCLLIK